MKRSKKSGSGNRKAKKVSLLKASANSCVPIARFFRTSQESGAAGDKSENPTSASNGDGVDQMDQEQQDNSSEEENEELPQPSTSNNGHYANDLDSPSSSPASVCLNSPLSSPHLLPRTPSPAAAIDNFEVVQVEAGQGAGMVQAEQRDLFTPFGVSICIEDVNGLPINDFGYAIKQREKFNTNFSRDQIRLALNDHWIPSIAADFPSSIHTKRGKDRPRRLNKDHLKSFPWLAVSKHPSFSGCWCVYCVLSKTSRKNLRVGNRSGTKKVIKNQILL
jgi:hypothetical protein